MTTAPAPRAINRTYAWWIILGLVGLDYFSSLAYLPSLALQHAGKYAPFAALGVVAVTLLAALPVYWYVVGRSSQGRGGIGLLEARFHGWAGKLLVLVLLGFVATDFVLTRSLSTSDAGTHIAANPYFQDLAKWVIGNRESVRGALPEPLQGRFFDFWDEQLSITVGLSILAFGLYFYLVQTLSKGFTRIAVGVVALYLLMNLLVVGSGAFYLLKRPDIIREWFNGLGYERTETGEERVAVLSLLWATLWGFPPVIIGLSGFELSMATAPMVETKPGDDPQRPQGRIRGARVMMLVAALLMCVFILGSIATVTLLVDIKDLEGSRPRPDGTFQLEHRALAYIAHGGKVIAAREDWPRAARGSAEPVKLPSQELLFTPFGKVFGTIYDLSSVLILCLAGASATISFRDIVPDFLSRFGMQLGWAHRTGLILHLFNGLILLVTVGFQASVEAQQWAYAASVLALLFGASLAAVLDIRERAQRSMLSWPVQVPFFAMCILFAGMGGLIVFQKPSGVAIALAFVLVVLVTAMVSRWLRAVELRSEGMDFKDAGTQSRWEEINKLEFQVLVPYDPRSGTIRHKEREIRETHRLGTEVPIIFVEVELGDPSDFYCKPHMEIVEKEGEEVIRITRATSIAHVIAAIALSFREVGRPPELHFNWSEKGVMEGTLSFVLFGQGNIPWMVHELLKRAEKDPARRPRVVVG